MRSRGRVRSGGRLRVELGPAIVIGRVPVLHRMTATAVPDSVPGCAAVWRRLRVRPPAAGSCFFWLLACSRLPCRSRAPPRPRRSWRCRGAGRSSPRGCRRSRRNSACSSSPRPGVTRCRRTLGTTTATCRAAPPPGIRRSGPSPRSSGSLASTTSVHARGQYLDDLHHVRQGCADLVAERRKVADNYEDFYDGSWDNKSGKGKNEFGHGLQRLPASYLPAANNNGTGRETSFGSGNKPGSSNQRTTQAVGQRPAEFGHGWERLRPIMAYSPSPRCSGSRMR